MPKEVVADHREVLSGCLVYDFYFLVSSGIGPPELLVTSIFSLNFTAPAKWMGKVGFFCHYQISGHLYEFWESHFPAMTGEKD